MHDIYAKMSFVLFQNAHGTECPIIYSRQQPSRLLRGSSGATSVCEGQKEKEVPVFIRHNSHLVLLGAGSPRQEENIQSPQGRERGGKITKRVKRKKGRRRRKLRRGESNCFEVSMYTNLCDSE